MTTVIWQIKLTLLVAIGFCITCGCLADTKVLAHINYVTQANREETISLENDNDLMIKGIYGQWHEIPHDPNNVLVATVTYVADKNGYHAKYILLKESSVQHASGKTLMTLAG